MLIWETARAVGFPESNLIMKLRFSHGAKQGYSVSLLSSPIRESLARHRRITMFWASLIYTPGLSIDTCKILSIMMRICLLRLSCCHLWVKSAEQNTVSRVLSYCLQFSNCANYCLTLRDDGGMLVCGERDGFLMFVGIAWKVRSGAGFVGQRR